MGARLPVLAAALWWGSLSAIGFVAVPLLFAHLPTSAMAGNVAARLFEAQTYISIACCALLLVVSKKKHAEKPEEWAQAAMVFVIAGLLLALLVQYGVAPRIVARQNLRLWHGAGSAMYALQWLCALRVLWSTARS
ncbi:DUF4149 domain-containing protein [Alicycliphilus denitrificans]|uniref:TMEM205-like domain-containing protein n=2 Tax=Alicycliphilus denitrificans TaxID=179636 RepID=F4GFM1_ALIDK|nr:DUF4149 domain-containing protein [Alicycliphilus denitrificans]ADV00236.1 hypothetical protein Alide_2502 [Alicycliphilus denitrificans BC]AEB85036.1 hypothetical protein Alide2_2679 [Alicycliphilus denitrificans K601]QKD43981.1 DUF4149 domain-containing protein [Alicycliphilus denitrificans]GAO23050.1 hypothetical protein ALISP_2870 [Alicycliphilus sp. B1]